MDLGTAPAVSQAALARIDPRQRANAQLARPALELEAEIPVSRLALAAQPQPVAIGQLVAPAIDGCRSGSSAGSQN